MENCRISLGRVRGVLSKTVVASLPVYSFLIHSVSGCVCMCEVGKRACFIFYFILGICVDHFMVFSLFIYLGFLCAPSFFLGPLLEDPEPATFVVILVAIVLACVSCTQKIIISILYFSFSVIW